ncbi:transcription regulator NC2 beta chain (NCB2) [Vairimorpha necatrix]|uniref:Transcription regulator NC2 beta chain (NCB2) n=1 Tax=Vairimorpha necatrix TaxID=6039 RepID=A0AAX4J8M7_9MICR
MSYENRDEENSLPKSTVERFVSSCLPKQVTVSKDAKEMFLNCSLEFIKLISVQSAAICEKDKKKTIAFEYFFKALEDKGFGEFVGTCKEYQEMYEKYMKAKPSKINKFKSSGLSLEELHNQQLELFKNAKQEFDKTMNGSEET